jgi:hypothetical protein
MIYVHCVLTSLDVQGDLSYTVVDIYSILRTSVLACYWLEVIVLIVGLIIKH